MEERHHALCRVLILLGLAVSAASAKGPKFQCDCSLNESRSYRLDITCYNQEDVESAVGCSKEERLSLSPGYLYIPGYGLYRLYTMPHCWTKARDLCKKDGGRLAIPKDGDMARTLRKHFNYDFYIGISDLTRRDDFIDVNGKIPPYLEWVPGLSARGPYDNCVALNEDGLLYTAFCYRPGYFLCEIPFTRSLPDGYVYLDTFGFFKIHTEKSTFTTAEKICQSEGGHLFLLETYEEAEAIVAFIKKEERNLAKIWTGLNDTVTEGSFMTFSGRSIDDLEFKNWNYGEPDNNNFWDGENCAVFSENGTIGDERCYMKYNFVCEIPPRESEET